MHRESTRSGWSIVKLIAAGPLPILLNLVSRLTLLALCCVHPSPKWALSVFALEDWRPETSYWILENHPVSRLINRQAKLGKQTITKQAGFSWEDLLPVNPRIDSVEIPLPELHESIYVT